MSKETDDVEQFLTRRFPGVRWTVTETTVCEEDGLKLYWEVDVPVQYRRTWFGRKVPDEGLNYRKRRELYPSTKVVSEAIKAEFGSTAGSVSLADYCNELVEIEAQVLGEIEKERSER